MTCKQQRSTDAELHGAPCSHQGIANSLCAHLLEVGGVKQDQLSIFQPSFASFNKSSMQPTWRCWQKHCCLHPKLQHCFPLQYFMFVCHFLLTQQVLPVAGCCQKWGLHCWWVAQAQPCSPSSSFPFLQPLPIGSAPSAWFDLCTFLFQQWPAMYSAVSPTAHSDRKVWCSQHKRTQTVTLCPHCMAGDFLLPVLVSFPTGHSWAGAPGAFCCETDEKVTSSQFFRQTPSCSCCNFGLELKSAAWLSAAPDDLSSSKSPEEVLRTTITGLIWS